MKDALWRTGYRIGFVLARLSWWLRRPVHHGALVAVWHGGRVLAVRQSYRLELNFPGGGIRAGETAVAAASRELGEEVGLAVVPEALTPAWEQVADWDYRRDHVRIFELVLAEPPTLRLDRREVVAATFLSPEQLLGTRLPPFLRDYVRAARKGPLRPIVSG
jgi:8-oxo-dGTP pyrophosphatase MutT (NUDIX family)